MTLVYKYSSVIVNYFIPILILIFILIYVMFTFEESIFSKAASHA